MKLVAFIVIAGCVPPGPDVGPLQVHPDGGTSTSCNADSDPNTIVSYSTDLVSGVFVRGRCYSCHTGGGEGVQQSGFNMGSYDTLRAGGSHTHAEIVVDSMPCSSFIVQKIDVSPPFGKRMPYNGPPYLSAHDIQLVRDWIAEGAHDN